jgi:hypothetical protein
MGPLRIRIWHESKVGVTGHNNVLLHVINSWLEHSFLEAVDKVMGYITAHLEIASNTKKF